MSVTMRVLAPAVTGEQRCHFLVQWRDSHAIQHGRTFTTWQEAAEFDAAIKAGKLPRDAPGRRAAVTFGALAASPSACAHAAKQRSSSILCNALYAAKNIPIMDTPGTEPPWLPFRGEAASYEGHEPYITSGGAASRGPSSRGRTRHVGT